MSYYNPRPNRHEQLIARRRHDALGSWFDDLTGAIKKGAGAVVNFYGESQRNAGAAAALTAQQQAAAAAAAPPRPGGISTTTLVVGGAAVVGLVLLLRK